MRPEGRYVWGVGCRVDRRSEVCNEFELNFGINCVKMCSIFVWKAVKHSLMKRLSSRLSQTMHSNVITMNATKDFHLNNDWIHINREDIPPEPTSRCPTSHQLLHNRTDHYERPMLGNGVSVEVHHKVNAENSDIMKTYRRQPMNPLLRKPKQRMKGNGRWLGFKCLTFPVLTQT